MSRSLPQPADLDDLALLARLLGELRGSDRPSTPTDHPLGSALAMLDRFDHPCGLARAGVSELAEAGGLPHSAAWQLAAGIELGRRTVAPPWPDNRPFTDPEEIWAHYRASLGTLDREVFLAVGLDVRCRRVCEVRVAEGSLTRCPVEPRDVFVPLLRRAAHAAVLVHNHPSGDPSPSVDDRRVTTRLAMAGRILGIHVVDHVIVGLAGYHSMAEVGAL